MDDEKAILNEVRVIINEKIEEVKKDFNDKIEKLNRDYLEVRIDLNKNIIVSDNNTKAMEKFVTFMNEMQTKPIQNTEKWKWIVITALTTSVVGAVFMSIWNKLIN